MLEGNNIMKKQICAVLALTLTAAACGGDAATEDSQIDTEVETTLGGDIEAADDTTTTVAVVEEVADGDVDLYCALWVTSEVEGEGFFESPESDVPENVRIFIEEQTGYLDQAIEAAPEALKGDLVLQRDGIVRIGEILEGNDWSLAASIGEMATDPQVNSDEAEAASDRLDAFNDENCQDFLPAEDTVDDTADDAVEDDATDDTASDDTTDTTDDTADGGDDIARSEAETLEALLQTDAGRQAFIDEITRGSGVTEEQAGCLVDNLDADMLVAMNDLDDINSPGAQAFLELLDTCDIPLEAFL